MSDNALFDAAYGEDEPKKTAWEHENALFEAGYLSDDDEETE